MKSESFSLIGPVGYARPDFLVVGVGGSAGGLEPFSQMLRALPAAPGLAIVIVQHPATEHESLLVELLARVSMMPLQWAKHGLNLARDHVYVAPAAHILEVRSDHFVLRPSEQGGDSVVDRFFTSLAGEYKHRSVGVVLSGAGADGVRGLGAVKAAGGITFAQTHESASLGAMPHAAVEAGAVDRVLPGVEEIARELVRLAQASHNAWKALTQDNPPDQLSSAHTSAIFRILDLRTGVDFSEYKPTTIRRRLVRRMALMRVSSLGDYVKLLQRSPDEVRQLYESLLINVTEFLRDPETFEFLVNNVLPEIMEHHADASPIRIWVAGCSTGEEAYSYAILLCELFETKRRVLSVQIFGTDLSDRAIAVARAGIYGSAAVAGLSASRLRRYFQRSERGYIVNKEIRDMCVFARQNVVRDSPFSRLDLISCRNVLIYLGAHLQQKVLPVFHYALNPLGILVLGSSESVGSQQGIFRLMDRSHRVYQRISGIRPAPLQFLTPHLSIETSPRSISETAMAHDPNEPRDAVKEADRIVLERYGPPGLLVSGELEILQFRGEITPFLAPLAGRGSLNLLKMAREDLAMELKAAVQQSREKKMRISRPPIMVGNEGELRQISVDVTPIAFVAGAEPCYLVLLLPLAPSAAAPGVWAKKIKKAAHSAQAEQLTRDLQSTRSYLHAAIEQHETANQQLRAANEEIQSSNEELQSTNEELETAKEELQSTNEELITMNEELHSRQVELMQVNHDLHNLINSVHLPIVMLGENLRIRRFTQMAEKMLNLIPSDIGRPFSDINTHLKLEELPRWIAEVTALLMVKEFEVQDTTGHWHLLRIRPYKAAQNKIDGVVITFIDIDQLKQMTAELEEMRNVAHALVEMREEPAAILSASLEIRTANYAFCRLFFVDRAALNGRSFVDMIRRSGGAQVGEALEKALAEHAPLDGFKAPLKFTAAKSPDMLLNVRQIEAAGRTYPLILVSLQSVAPSTG